MPGIWIFTFFKEAYGELKKATWLSKREVVQSTIVVMILVMLVAVYIASVDFVLSIALSSVMKSR